MRDATLVLCVRDVNNREFDECTARAGGPVCHDARRCVLALSSLTRAKYPQPTPSVFVQGEIFVNRDHQPSSSTVAPFSLPQLCLY